MGGKRSSLTEISMSKSSRFVPHEMSRFGLIVKATERMGSATGEWVMSVAWWVLVVSAGSGQGGAARRGRGWEQSRWPRNAPEGPGLRGVAEVGW